LIYPHEFSPDLVSIVQEFNCGPDEWSKDVNSWIRGGPDDGESALSCIANQNRWCRVWIYSTGESPTPETLVGYSSLGLGRWPFGTTKIPIGTIPFLGVDLRFQKQYHEGKESFAMGMYRDLLSSADALLDPQIKILGLYVDPRNDDGIKFWRKCGFENLEGKTYLEHGVAYQGMFSQFR